MIVRRIFSYGLSCYSPCYLVSSSQSSYSGIPPIFLGRSPDLLWALWGQLRLKPVHTPTCTCFQIPQLPPNATPSSQLWGFNLLLLWLQEEIHFLFGHTASVAHTQVLPCLCRLRSGVCFPPRQDGADAEAYWTHSLSWAGKREGYGRCKWNVRGGPGAVKAFGVAAARGRSSTLSGELALGHGNLGNAKVHELREGVGYDLCLLAASCTCDPWGWACGATHPLPVALPLALTAAGRCACL